jgi:hypothetical protein
MRVASRSNVEPRSLTIGLFSVAPYVVFAHPLVDLILARSEVPLVLGRYSPFLATIRVTAAMPPTSPCSTRA